jgi:ADP-ribosylglycohydrolase
MDRSCDGLLLGVRDLHAQRAPGNTCLSALASMTRIEGGTAPNDSKGCGGVMSVAPVGLFAECRGREFGYGREFAALTHGHPTGSLAAGAFALLVGELFRGSPLPDALSEVDAELIRHHDHEETLVALRRAVALAGRGLPTPENLESLGGGWVAEEALAIAVYCALTATSFEDGVLRAVNHSGDSDSTGSIAGNLLGLLYGEEALPARWLAQLELRELIARVAEDLVDSPNFRLVGEPQNGWPRGWDVYPSF